MSDPTRQALLALFLGFPSQERAGNERELIRVYRMATEGIHADFVALAVKRFIQGQVQRANLQWRPTPAELASEARRLQDQALEAQRLDALRLPKPERSADPEVSPEARRQGAEMARRVAAEMRAAAQAAAMPSTSRYRYRQPTKDELAASRDRIEAWEREQEK